MPQIFAARAQMGTSLVFHIVFSVLGVGLPLLLCIAEGVALRRQDATLLRLARQWSKAFGIIFAIGAVSGAIVEFEITLLWPTFARFSGSIIGLPFAMEGFAFFIEGIFVGLYIYGWSRLSPRVHWLCSFPLWISGAVSAFFITTANSWMNTPAGFTYQNGKVSGVDPIAAMFNPSTPYETVHMILASYVATGFAVAAVYAIALLRGDPSDYNRKGLALGTALGGIAIPLQIFSGDLNARFLEGAQPAKYAAMEGLLQSGNGLPLYLGGFPNEAGTEMKFAIPLPHGESLLSHFNTTAHSRGLDTIPRSDWPSVTAVHLSFDAMVGAGFFILLVAGVFGVLYVRGHRTVPTQRWLLWGLAAAGPLAMLAVEAGWFVTEEGRQPWIINGITRVSQAATPSQWMNISFLIFSAIYVVLGVTLVLLLLRVARTPEPARSWAEYMPPDGGDGSAPHVSELEATR
ncbi:MAG: cytochrome ubiquinol oxidase subunit I [Ktedonobacterales bacterium]|nr:cytochrome ubiquinol oxidase subunit I [Ktedonobacterales bacterium]